MDSEKDSHLWQFKWHIVMIGATLGVVLLLALFTCFCWARWSSWSRC